jgi:hypothetical protein
VLTGLRLITADSLAGLVARRGCCNAFETPTRQSIFVQMLDRREDLPNAIALNSMLMNGTRLVGPSIGGLLIAAFDETVCFALNALAIVAVLVGALPAARAQRAPPRAHAPARGPRRGLALRDGTLPLRRMLLTLAAVSFAISPYTTLMPAMTVRDLRRGLGAGGHLHRRVGLGRSSRRSRSRARRASRARALDPVSAASAGWAASASAVAIVWCSSAALMVLTGFGMFMTGADCNTILQSVVDDDKRSRVMSYYTMSSSASRPSDTSPPAGSRSTSAWR